VFLDSDDVLLPGSLAALLEAAEQQPEAGVIGGGYLRVDERLNELGRTEPWRRSERLDPERWLTDCPFIPSATLVSLDWFRRVGGFDTRQAAAQDWDLWLRLGLAGCPMAWLKQPVCQYRLHAGGLTQNVAARRDAALAMLARAFDHPRLAGAGDALKAEAVGLVRLRAAAQWFAAGQADAARAELAQAAALRPEWQAAEAVLADLLRLGREAHAALDPAGFDALVFSALGAGPQLRRRVAARLEAGAVFAAYSRRDWRAVRRAWWLVITQDASWLANRGFLAIGLRAFFRQPAP
jgi:hypothetical protein